MRKFFFLVVLFFLVFSVSWASENKTMQSTRVAQEKCDAPMWNVGDSWKFGNEEIKVIRVEDDLYIVQNSSSSDLIACDKKTLEKKYSIDDKGRRVKITSALPLYFDFPLDVGKKWKRRFSARPSFATRDYDFLIEYKVLCIEKITVAAGTFNAYKIEIEQTLYDAVMAFAKTYVWYSPEVKAPVKVASDTSFRHAYGSSYWKDAQNFELMSFSFKSDHVKESLVAEQRIKEEVEKGKLGLKEKESQEPKGKGAPDLSEEKIKEVKQAGKPPLEQTESIKLKDLLPPKITISSPAMGKEMVVASNEPRMSVVGKVTDESSVEKVTLNKETVTLDQNGQFSSSVPLKIGENEINVVAIDVHKNHAALSFKVIRGTVEAKIPQPSPASKAAGKYYGLIIGNNDYRYVSKLEIARRDAVEVEKVLRERYGFETKLLLDATRLAILNAINDLRKRLKEEDSVLVYYAGHGYYDAVADKAYWMPVDAERDNPANWIMSDDITTNIKRMTSKHILIVSDSCYSGAFVRSSEANLSSRSDRRHFITRMLEKTSRTLMSSGGNEPVLDSGGSGHSVFAESFLKGLTEIQEKVFTADELFYEAIRERVIGKSEQTPQYSNIRNSGHEGGDFVFIKK